jgi:pimeloyl-ACP methyl ester carboxylesterase
MGRRVVVVVCAAALALLGAGRAAAYTRQDLTLTMDDGVGLAATVYEPSVVPPPGGFPAIVMLHGLGGRRQDLEVFAQSLADSFAVLTFDARGHGQSGGLVSIDGPREIADTRAVFDWLAARPEVDRTHIGALGISLGGGAVLRSLVEGVPWAAVETLQTWTDLYSALAPQNLAKSGAIYQFLSSVPENRLDPSVLAIRDDAVASRNLPRLRAFARARSSRQLLSRVRTPVLMLQGRRDFAFGIEQATAAMRLLRGPHFLYVGDFGHAPSTFPGPDLDYVRALSGKWFGRFLMGLGPQFEFRVELAPETPSRPSYASYRGLPPTRRPEYALRGRRRIGPSGKIVRVTRPVRAMLETFGSPVVRAPVRLSGGWSRLVAVLTAKPPRGPEIVVSEGGVNTAGLRGRRRLAIRLIDQATLIPRGSRLELTLAASSLAQNPGNLLYLNLPMPSGARISIGDAELTLPVLRRPVSR